MKRINEVTGYNLKSEFNMRLRAVKKPISHADLIEMLELSIQRINTMTRWN